MSLASHPLVYVFLETCEPEVQRHIFENTLSLELIEIEPHLPHHRHGVVKYDAGTLIVSLNEATGGAFSQDYSDGLLMGFSAPADGAIDDAVRRGYLTSTGDGVYSDPHGHHYRFQRNTESCPEGRTLLELELVVNELEPSIGFYRDRLGLSLVDRTAGFARFATASADICLREGMRACDGRGPRAENYLIVFHSDRIAETFQELVRSGVAFKGGIATSEIGRTIRFRDDFGHRLCVYEPSEVSLQWGSGAKVLEIAGMK